MTAIILASASPRRRELIHQIGWTANIKKSHFQEVSDAAEAEERRKENPVSLLAPFSGAGLVCAVNALGKAEDVLKHTETDLPVLGADTVVTLEGEILGKPANEEEASKMLHFLSGKTHQVKTGVALLAGGRKLLQVVTTEVKFRNLSEEEIHKYVATGEPMDKAGSYGIQGIGTLLVESISGSYDNVVGLPLVTVYEMMQTLQKDTADGTISRR